MLNRSSSRMLLVALILVLCSTGTLAQISSLFSPLLPDRCPSPPCYCNVDNLDRKMVVCSSGITQLPIAKMDPKTQVLNITAPADRYNTIRLGRIFSELTELEELHITRSKLPMIGDSTFCSVECSTTCDSPLKLLNLSQNNINFVRKNEFNCLNNLLILDLSDNNMAMVPSAAFSNLKNLTKLSLARNKLDQLSPLMFHSLTNLVTLDLSENPLLSISSDVLKDVPNLRSLILNNCQLTRLSPMSLSVLSSLDYLDLSDNHLKHIDTTALTNLHSVRKLLLSRNSLTVLPDYVFANLSLDLLDLSGNLLNPLKACTFCNATRITTLNLSENKISSFTEDHLIPISDSLAHLTLDRNLNLVDAKSSLVSLLQPLRRLKSLSIVNIGLDEKVPESVFDNLKSLNFLNMSSNKFRELSGRLISNLYYLNTLDVSSNELTFLDPSAFQIIGRMQYLSRIYFQNNPFSCYRCHILPFIDWLNTDPPAYWNVCGKLTDDPNRLIYCAQCATPANLFKRYLHEPDITMELEWCVNPEVQLRLTASEPQVGLILAFLIIMSLIAVILVVVAIYRKNGAVYYTQEDKLNSNEKLYAARVGAPITSWANPTGNRIVSLSSGTNYTTSRQNTMFSPQSSLDQTPVVHYATDEQSPPTTASSNGVCDTCANSTAVKQVIASIPAMTELLESSIQKESSNGTSGKPNGVKTKKNGKVEVVEVGKIEEKSHTSVVPPIPEVNEPNEVEFVVVEQTGSGTGPFGLDDSNVDVQIYI